MKQVGQKEQIIISSSSRPRIVWFFNVVLTLLTHPRMAVRQQRHCGLQAQQGTAERALETSDGTKETEKVVEVRADVSLSVEDIITHLSDQRILRGVSQKVIERIAKRGRIVVVEDETVLTRQGDNDGDLFFILDGKIRELINDREMAVRESGESVGDLSVFNPQLKRSATLIARERVMLLRLQSEDLKPILKKERERSIFLYNLANVFACRLRERSKFQLRPNACPRIFIGSSLEAVEIARKLRVELEKSKAVTVVDWTDGVFRPSRSSMECLESLAPTCDFAILLLSGDDRILYRGKELDAPRDNIVFELGFFMGKIGRQRSYFVLNSAKIPSDLNGETFLAYKLGKRGRISWGNTVDTIVDEVKKMGVR